jgi:hypothetical protein
LKINNSLGKTFGGPPLFAAYLFLGTGIIVVPFDNFSPLAVGLGVVFVLASAFVIFTLSGVEIDTETGLVKQYNKIFGLIKTGKWQSLDAFIGVTLIHMKKIYRIASRANLTTSTTEKDYRIFLVNKNRRPAFAIKKCKTPDQAQKSLDEFSIWLKCPVFTTQKKYF